MDGAKQDNNLGMGSGRLGDRGEVEWGVRKDRNGKYITSVALTSTNYIMVNEV